MFSFGRIQLRRFFLSSVLSLLVLLLFFWIGSAYPAQVTLAWDPNTDPDLAGYGAPRASPWCHSKHPFGANIPHQRTNSPTGKPVVLLVQG